VSNTLDYGKFNIQDTTEYIRGTLPVWKKLGFSFDAICTGLMFSDEQAKLVANYCKEQGEAGTWVFVDPILGDGGRLYNGMTERQVELMREMVSVAHLTFPNYTEACYLTNTPIHMEGISWESAADLLDKLRDIGCRIADRVANAVSIMPKWIPGRHNGARVDAKYTLPVTFRLTPSVEDN
jgi:pyridoxine kinase